MGERYSDFVRALEARLDQTDWCFAYGVFSQDLCDWYVSSTPCLTPKTGVNLNLTYKPMAVDRLFWEMVGLSADNRDTLSFRNRRLWTLQAPQYIEHFGEDISDTSLLADLVIDRAHSWFAARREHFTVSDMLKRLGPHDQLSEDQRILAICLAVLADDEQTAHRLARCGMSDDLPDAASMSEYSFISADGRSSTLISKARDWLVARRRNGLRLINES